MSDPSASHEDGFSTDSPRAATVETHGVRRQVRVFGVLEQELEELSLLNANASIFFAVTWSLVSLAAGILTAAGFTEHLPPEGLVLTRFGAPFLVALAIVFYLLYRGSKKSRVNALERIRRQSNVELPDK